MPSWTGEINTEKSDVNYSKRRMVADGSARASTFPVLSVWLGDKPRIFRVARVESVIPAYRAEERLREVSSLGLRFLAEDEVLTALQSPEMHDRSIVIEGWLRPSAGVLRVRSVRVAEEFPGKP